VNFLQARTSQFQKVRKTIKEFIRLPRRELGLLSKVKQSELFLDIAASSKSEPTTSP
jgi:hypothetical protein